MQLNKEIMCLRIEKMTLEQKRVELHNKVKRSKN